MAMNERRQSTRFDVHGIHGTLRFTVEVMITNLSVTGMALETSSQLGVGRPYTFRVFDGDKEVAVSGTVAWCVLQTTRKNDNGAVLPVYRAGIHFGEVLTGQAHKLVELIEHNAIVEPGQRLFGRFHLKSSDPLTIDSASDFTVLKLSTTGMLVEAALPPALDSIVALDMRVNGTRLTGTARVAFIQDTGNLQGSARAAVGLEFLDLTKQEREAVSAMIAAGIQ